VVTEDKAEEVETDWDGRLQRLKEYLEKSVDNQNKLLKTLRSGISTSIMKRADKRVEELEKSSGTIISMVSSKAQEALDMLDKCHVFLKIDKKQ